MPDPPRDMKPRAWYWTILPPFSALTDWIGLIILYVVVLIYNVANPLVEGYDVRLLVWALFTLFVIIIYSMKEYDRIAYKTSLKCTAGDKGTYTIESFKELGEVPGVKHKEKGKVVGQARPHMKAWVVSGKDKPFHITGRLIFILPEEYAFVVGDCITFNVKFKPFSMLHRELDEDIVDTLKGLEHKKFSVYTPVYMGWTPVVDPADLKKRAKELSYDPIAHEKRWQAVVNFYKDVLDTLVGRIARMEGKDKEEVKKDIQTPKSLP
ncbi:MAG: hypothetical protein KAR39_12840 [Thermoplasmata archaeon]|nr:hypothetical protein [Thermoplasmata archaeon]